jgi:hypothetical protein
MENEIPVLSTCDCMEIEDHARRVIMDGDEKTIAQAWFDGVWFKLHSMGFRVIKTDETE